LIPVQAPPPKEEERVTASHVLISYKGARGAPPNVTRTKERAKKRAEEVMKKAKAGGDFAALAKQYSDDLGSGPRGGELGAFPRRQMVAPFADAAFALKPGEVSGIVETDFGFHVIKRTQ
jgi:peptidyl-prolyl cis-trans isomerase D